MYNYIRRPRIRHLYKRPSHPLKWAIAIALFILVLTLTWNDATGASVITID